MLNRLSKYIRFYLLRIRNATLREIIDRLRQALIPLYLRVAKRLEAPPFQMLTVDPSNIRQIRMPNLVPVDDRLLREKILSYFANESLAYENPSFGRNVQNIDRLSDEADDIRIVWEPARLQFATELLIYALHFSKSSYSREAKDKAKYIVLKWINENPFPEGIHYVSAMECGLRIPVFFYVLRLLKELDQKEQNCLLRAIYQHAWLISKRLSLFSSRGNHTIAESVGLIFAGTIFRKTSVGHRWFENGVKLMKRELPLQILDDGGPAEQAFGYHRFVLDLYWLTTGFLTNNSLPDANSWQDRLLTGESFISAFQDSCGRFPLIGDSDDGHAVAPSLLPKHKIPKINHQIQNVFSKSGHTVVKNNNILFTFNHSCLGMPPLFNHGHADALSITLTKKGVPVLVDSGTYRYNGVPEWRQYFKGTRAHNTVTIDNLDQAFQETSFIWSRPYETKLNRPPFIRRGKNGGSFFHAMHNGYSKSLEGVYHLRSILFFDEGNFLIKDSFQGRGNHRFEINFHFHPNISIQKEKEWWVAKNNQNTLLFINILNEKNVGLLKGERNPIFGWYSAEYGKLQETNVLTCLKSGKANTSFFLTAIFTKKPPASKIIIERIIELETQAKYS